MHVGDIKDLYYPSPYDIMTVSCEKENWCDERVTYKCVRY